MSKRILIISSNITGHGHKSITDSLMEHFSKYDVNIKVVDGFTLGGNFTFKLGKMYGSVTRNAKEIWKMIWEISSSKPSLIDDFIELMIRDNFLRLLKKTKPDIIVSVHPNYNGSVLNILEELGLKIPFVTIIADLVSISPLWACPKADYIICPTEESKQKCIEYGVPEHKCVVTGFPIRSKFFKERTEIKQYKPGQPLNFLIMSGGEGSGDMSRIAKQLLNYFTCNVKIITGRNRSLKKRLELTLKDKYGDRVDILGFVDNIQDVMHKCDIIFTRGSPNSSLEVVACNIPLVVTGALPGQEEGNPKYIEDNNLGVVCKNPKYIKQVVKSLLDNNGAKLKKIIEAQKEYADKDIPKRIVDFIMNIETNEKIDYNAVLKNLKMPLVAPFDPSIKNEHLTKVLRARRISKKRRKLVVKKPKNNS